MWLVFPGTEEARRAVASKFETKFGLPDVLGAIDCTHITLFPPPGFDNAQFRNHHGVMSINTQLVRL